MFSDTGQCPQSALVPSDFSCLLGIRFSLKIWLAVPHYCVNLSVFKVKFLIFLICVLFVFKSAFLFVFKSKEGVSE